MKKKIIAIITISGILFLGSGFRMFQEEPKPWPVPDKNAKMSNPLKSDAETLKTGKDVWVKHCQSCHGKQGKGDGSKAAQLKTAPGDFSTASFHTQSDGAIYYKTTEGRDDMPAFKKKIPDEEERWAVVTYLRTFKK